MSLPVPDAGNSSSANNFAYLHSLTLAVCKIIGQDGRDKGTGFLIGPNLIMTCNHVIPDQETAGKCKACFYEHTEIDREPGGSRFRFEGAVVGFDKDGFFECSKQKTKLVGTRVVADLADQGNLDYTIATLKTHSKLQGLPAVFSLLEPSQAKDSTVAYVFQHPDVPDADTGLKGLFKVAPGNFNTGSRSDYEVHYQTPTAPGSSGGAVLNPQGQLIALHYWGGIENCPHCREKDPADKGKKPVKTSYCNAGILISKIVDDLESRGKLKSLKDYITVTGLVNFSTPAKILNPPGPPRNFIRREKELASLEEKCGQGKKVVIHGLGGVGKTVLALVYAEKHQKDYQLIHFISARSFKEASEGLIQLAGALKIPGEKSDDRLFSLTARLENQEAAFLLIFDGLDQMETLHALEKFLPNQGKTLLLFTSRLKAQFELQDYLLVPLRVFDPEEGRAFLLEAVNRSTEIDRNEEQASLLSKKLHHLPLALTHAATYIRNTLGFTFAKYIEEWDNVRLKLFQEENLDLKKGEQTILTTWKASIKAIKTVHKSPLAKEVLRLLSVLDSTPIPLKMVDMWMQTAHPDFPLIELRNALRHLQNYSLVEGVGETCVLHFLVQEVVRHNLNPLEFSQKVSQALQACWLLVEGLDPEISKSRKKLGLFVPHIVSVLEHAKNNRLDNIDIKLFLLKKLWNYYYQEGEYHFSEKWALEEVNSRACMEESIEAVDARKRLGLSLYWLGKSEDAREIFIDVLEARKNQLGKEALEVAEVEEDLGWVENTLGNYGGALARHQEACRIRRRLLGNFSILVAESLDAQAEALGGLERYKESLKASQDALDIAEACVEGQDLRIAKIKNRLGMAYSYSEDYKASLEFFMDALAIRRNKLGDLHPKTMECVHNIGTLLLTQKDYLRAEKFLRKFSEDNRDFLANYSPYRAVLLHNLGRCFVGLEKYDEALDSFIEAFEITYIISKDHFNCKRYWNDIVACMEKCFSGEMSSARADNSAFNAEVIDILKRHRGEKRKFLSKLDCSPQP